MQNIVELAQVSRDFIQGTTTVHAVRDLTLYVARGEFTALAGPSGSGKTTTLNMIGALDVPTRGAVRLEGVDLATLPRHRLAEVRRSRIGFVFQAYNLIPVLTAFENAEFVLALQGVPLAERTRRVTEILAAVGLAGMENRRPDELSGGQQQRVAIARAIAPRPAIVLADEPTANVDSETAEALLTLMEDLNRTHGVTFLFSTHDDRVLARARRIVRMRDGQIETEEYREAPRPEAEAL